MPSVLWFNDRKRQESRLIQSALKRVREDGEKESTQSLAGRVRDIQGPIFHIDLEWQELIAEIGILHLIYQNSCLNSSCNVFSL